MKVTLWMAVSVNGYIARKDNNEDFISHDSWLAWLKTIKQAGCLIWGRKTYEIVKTWGEEYLNDLKGLRAVIVTTDLNYQVPEGFNIARSPLIYHVIK